MKIKLRKASLMEKEKNKKSKWIWYNKNNRAYIPKENN